MRRGVVAAALAIVAFAAAHVAPAGAAVPPIKHVFIVILENESADSTFGPGSKAPYLAQTLRAQGAFIPGYYAIGHLSLDNYIAMVSGQGPNPWTQADAPLFTNFLPGTPAANGQYLGFGAVYPTQVKTIANQLDAKGRTWGGYMEDMANSTTGEPKTCRHPPIGAQDHTQSARPGDQYATRHNPYMYFHSIIDDQPKCNARVVDLTKLPNALQSASTTPNYTFITPNLCHDGHDDPCVDDPSHPGGLPKIDAWLRREMPPLLASPGFRDDGLLIVTFDEAEDLGGVADASACCGEQPGPNTINPGGPTLGPGGGRIGAVLVSPFIRPGTFLATPYNHYSLLRSIENLFGVGHLGFAAQSGLRAFGAEIFNQTPRLQLKVRPRTLRRGRTRVLRIEAGRQVRIRVRGACGRRTRTTDTRGRLRLRVRPRHRGVCRITASRGAWHSTLARVTVR
jgi:phosphatidylinositol-3-phosphatase